jgi:NADH:ubiquinone oxidoreductase subunit 5 (subunit L)/multisubunit Na+/H+ antiporter MnhA subunit
MTRRIHVVVGLAATILNVVGIVCLLRWAAKTDFLFGHYEGPAICIVTALWTSLIGVIATVAWFLIRLYGKPASQRSTRVKPASSKLMLFQGIALAVLLLPACLTVLIGVAKFPAAWVQLQVDRVKSGAATRAELMEGLKSPESRIRSTAARALGLIKERSAVESLLSCLGDENISVRVSAAQALARIEDPRAMKPLMEALEDESYMVRVWAASGLATIGDTSCIPALEEFAQKDAKNRRRLERAIEAIRNREGSER